MAIEEEMRLLYKEMETTHKTAESITYAILANSGKPFSEQKQWAIYGSVFAALRIRQSEKK